MKTLAFSVALAAAIVLHAGAAPFSEKVKDAGKSWLRRAVDLVDNMLEEVEARQAIYFTQTGSNDDDGFFITVHLMRDVKKDRSCGHSCPYLVQWNKVGEECPDCEALTQWGNYYHTISNLEPDTTYHVRVCRIENKQEPYVELEGRCAEVEKTTPAVAKRSQLDLEARQAIYFAQTGSSDDHGAFVKVYLMRDVKKDRSCGHSCPYLVQWNKVGEECDECEALTQWGNYYHTISNLEPETSYHVRVCRIQNKQQPYVELEGRCAEVEKTTPAISPQG